MLEDQKTEKEEDKVEAKDQKAPISDESESKTEVVEKEKINN